MFKRSQIALTDFLIALFTSTILIMIIIFSWNMYTVILSEDADYKEMQIIAFQTADLLVKSMGEPENWEENPTNVSTIGLASSDRYLSIEKVDAFINLTYNITSKSLGVELYNFYFKLKHINGTKLAEYGRSPSNFVINVPRLVLYKNEKAIVEFALWR